MDVSQALGRGNGSSWISTKYAGLRALHAGVRQGPVPEASGLPCPLLGMACRGSSVGIPAKSSSEGEKKVLTLKQSTMGFLGSFLGGFGGHLLIQPAAPWCYRWRNQRAAQDENPEEMVGLPCPCINGAVKSASVFLQAGVRQRR